VTTRDRETDIELIADMAGFHDLKADWERLLAAGHANVFQTWTWQYTWWRHFGSGKTLQILLVKDRSRGEVIGIAPCYQHLRPAAPGITLRRIGLLGTRHADPDFLDLILAPGREAEALTALAQFWSDRRHLWDILELGDVAETSPYLPQIREVLGGRFTWAERPSMVCPYIELPGSFEEYLDTLTPKKRKKTRYETKRLRKLEQLEWVDGFSVAEADHELACLFQLHEARFRTKHTGKACASDFSGEEVRAFHRDLASALAEQDQLRWYALRHGPDFIACLYLFKHLDSVFLYQMGISPEWRSWSLGVVLIAHAIEDSIREGAREFHFLRGDEPYKRDWAKQTRTTRTLTCASGSLKGRLWIAWLRTKTWLKRRRAAAGLRP